VTYDAHAYLGNNPAFARTGLPVPFEAPAWVEMMDAAGLDGALVAPPGSGTSEDFLPDLERIARGAREFPGRLFGWARVKPRQGQAAIDTLRQLVEQEGFKCLKMNTLDDNYRLDDRRLIDPVIETADGLGIPVFFHTGDAHGATCTPGMVADIAVDFPRTTFIIGHCGFPGHSHEVVPSMKRAPNTVTETAGEYRPAAIQAIVDEVGAERVLMGSNGPYTPIALAPVMIGQYMGRLSDGEKEAIMGKNLLRVLKVSA